MNTLYVVLNVDRGNTFPWSWQAQHKCLKGLSQTYNI